LLVGWVFDKTNSYAIAFELCAAMIFAAAIAILPVAPAPGVETIPAGELRAMRH
jgi:hypothetical protein